MRNIGKLENKEQVKAFQSYLYYHGIESHNYEEEDDCEIWVLRDEQKEKALQYLEKFRVSYVSTEQKNSSGESLESEIQKGMKKIKEEQLRALEKEKKAKVIDVRTSISRNNGFNIYSVTGFLLLSSVLVFFLQGGSSTFISKLSFSNNPFSNFYEISQGEVWRFITPIFLHFGFMHILFNMMILYQIGPVIEKKEGSLFYGIMILILALGSNTLFYLFVGANFGGMSGVLFGLVAYTWAYSRLVPNATEYFPIQSYARFLVIWCVICFLLTMLTNMKVANIAHTVGALVGIALGFVRALVTKKSNFPPSWILRNQETSSGILIAFGLTFLAILVDTQSLF